LVDSIEEAPIPVGRSAYSSRWFRWRRFGRITCVG